MEEKKILSIGAGLEEKKSNLVRLDINPDTNPDICWDLNQFPYPIEDNSFDMIDCYDVIEHVDNIPKVIEECHRILKPNGLLRMTTPHFSCANSYIDPTHKYHLSYFSFDYFDDAHEFSYYSPVRFKMIERQIRFDQCFPIKNIFYKLANRFPRFYERRLAWIFPAWFLYFELGAIKK